jgi:putative ABC transport system permease protein
LVAGVSVLELVNMLLSKAEDKGFFGTFELNFKTALTALTVLVISGLFASMLPASKAAAVNPIVALQDE